MIMLDVELETGRRSTHITLWHSQKCGIQLTNHLNIHSVHCTVHIFEIKFNCYRIENNQFSGDEEQSNKAIFNITFSLRWIGSKTN